MNKLPVAVVDEEAEGGPKVIARFPSVIEAEIYIESLISSQAEKVYRGGFGIDAPQETP